MALPPLLFETIVSPIEQAGDYFIMDSEQLVSRPYHDMQRESIDEGFRKTSLSEKLTNVRNKVTNNSLTRAKDHLQKKENTSLRDMHESSSKLRYHVKLLDLDRRKYTIEMNKRLQPTKDYSYDDQQVETSEKRLGVMGPCYYLQKDLRYPVRHSGLQETVTPALAKARKTLNRYKFELLSPPPEMSICRTLSRASSKRNASARLETPSISQPNSAIRRKSWSAHGSPSAGSASQRDAKWRFFTQGNGSTNGSVLDVTQDSTLGNSLPRISQSTGSLNIHSTHRGQSGHKVKFAVPKKPKTFAKLDAHILARSKTFHQGDKTPITRSCYIQESDDEEPPPRKVDLQAVLFGKTPTQSRPSTQGSSLGKRKRSMYNAPGHLTQEMLEKESAMIQRKINTFLNKVETWDPTIRFDTDSSSDEEDYIPAPIVPKAHVTPFSRHFLSQMAEEERQEEEKEKEAKAQEQKEKELQDNEQKADKKEQEDEADGQEQIEGEKTSAIQKWKDIVWRVTKPNATKEKNLSTEDLILQRIMGLEVSTGNSKKSGVPLNSASRALRHTPTFKMQKVVEDLTSGRTKFQQFEVDTLKKQLESGVDISELENTPQPKPETPKWKPGGTSFLPDDLSELSEEEEQEEEEEGGAELPKLQEGKHVGFNLSTI